MEIATRRREQEVWQACDDLWSLNGDMKSLTGDLIRDRLVHLGKSRGSPNEIYKYRKSWMMSRGVSPSAISFEEGELDPISRAVRMVHEQLKAEASAQINKLEQDFLGELRQKEDLLADKKQALDKVMAEFSLMEQECTKAIARIKMLEEQLGSEIDLRKASEREILRFKSLLEQEKQAHDALVQQIKEIYQNEMAQAKSREHEQAIAADAKINTLIDEKRTLGHEYSEKLNDIKTALYNQEIMNKHTEQKLRAAMGEIKSLNEALAEENNKVDQKNRDNASLSSALIENSAELARIKALKNSLEGLLKKEMLARKKSELTVARLRAHLYHKPRGGDHS